MHGLVPLSIVLQTRASSLCVLRNPPQRLLNSFGFEGPGFFQLPDRLGHSLMFLQFVSQFTPSSEHSCHPFSLSAQFPQCMQRSVPHNVHSSNMQWHLPTGPICPFAHLPSHLSSFPRVPGYFPTVYNVGLVFIFIISCL